MTYRRESHVAREARKREKHQLKALEREREINFKVEEAKKATEMQKIQLEINVEMLQFFGHRRRRKVKTTTKKK